MYPFYIYCNFSGYIDIVIGIARFLRIKLPENFNRPFSSKKLFDFLEPLAHHPLHLAADLRLCAFDARGHAPLALAGGRTISEYLRIVRHLSSSSVCGMARHPRLFCSVSCWGWA